MNPTNNEMELMKIIWKQNILIEELIFYYNLCSYTLTHYNIEHLKFETQIAKIKEVLK